MTDQIILVDKPAGISSCGVVAKIRKELTTKFGHKIKVGHTGTLDPFATGLLILLTGKMTKKSNEFLKLDKVYEATLKLGFVSTTGDPEGEIQEYLILEHTEATAEYEGARPVSTGASDPSPKLSTLESTLQSFVVKISPREYYPSLEEITSVISSFVGTITQTPPKFSAIKINGERAYKLARKGKDFEIPSRTVEIYSIEILEYNYPELKIRTHVSSGTYIRTLAEDIGKKLGTGAYLTSLRRIKIGNYSISDAITMPID